MLKCTIITYEIAIVLKTQNNGVLKMLKQKHQEGKKSHHEVTDNVHHTKFDSINADLV